MYRAMQEWKWKWEWKEDSPGALYPWGGAPNDRGGGAALPLPRPRPCTRLGLPA